MSDQIVQWLLQQPQPESVQALMRCCGSTRWAELLHQALPDIKDDQSLFERSDHIWKQMDQEDYLEAFSHHPQIGADPEQIRRRFKSTQSWSSEEQSGMNEADEGIIQRLAQGNREYLERFGYIFIVCATGKSAVEMLDLLEARLPNAPEDELLIAAQEQAKITRLRMEKLS